jgi:hypothetical protein
MEAEGRDTSAGRIRQEFEIVERAATVAEASEHVNPSRLLFITVRELDMRMRQRGG